METSTKENKYQLSCGKCNGACKIDLDGKNDINKESKIEKGKIYKGECGKKDCLNQFNFTQCVKCEKLTKINEKIENNLKPKCEKCNKVFAIYICPKETCNKFIITSVHYEGYLVTCDSPDCKAEFSQLSCLKCKRLLVFLSGKNSVIEDNHIKANRFVEGQIIKCPFEDCESEFSMMNCFTCFKPNKFDDKKLKNGETLICKEGCRNKICKLFCIFCFRILWYKDGIYHEGKKVVCPYSDCGRFFEAVKCPKCLRYNCWEDNSYHCGQPAVCVYKNCQYKFKKLDCPHCGDKREVDSFRFGSNNVCASCKNQFTYNICICNYTMMVKVHYSEAQGIKCINESCKKDVHNGYCPHCNNIVILLRTQYRFGMKIVCPWKECRKSFNYLYCRACGEGIYNKEADYVQGSVIKCPKFSCGETYQMINCGFCSRGIQYTTRQDIFSSSLTCVYNDCKNDFFIGSIHDSVYHPSAVEFNLTGKYIIYLTPIKATLTSQLKDEQIQNCLNFKFEQLKIEDEGCSTLN